MGDPPLTSCQCRPARLWALPDSPRRGGHEVDERRFPPNPAAHRACNSRPSRIRAACAGVHSRRGDASEPRIRPKIPGGVRSASGVFQRRFAATITAPLRTAARQHRRRRASDGLPRPFRALGPWGNILRAGEPARHPPADRGRPVQAREGGATAAP